MMAVTYRVSEMELDRAGLHALGLAQDDATVQLPDSLLNRSDERFWVHGSGHSHAHGGPWAFGRV